MKSGKMNDEIMPSTTPTKKIATQDIHEHEHPGNSLQRMSPLKEMKI